jgi:hypothetical protein
MRNDEFKAARLLTFIIHHSSFIIKTETPPDTSRVGGSVRRRRLCALGLRFEAGASRVTPHAAARTGVMLMTALRGCVRVTLHSSKALSFFLGARLL